MEKPVKQTVEVTQWWGEEVLDVRTFAEDAGRVSIGFQPGSRWRFLGVDMGFVPGLVGPVLRALGPGWSEVQRERRADFAVPEATDDGDWDLVVRSPDKVVVRVPPGWTADREGVAADDGAIEVAVGEHGVSVERAPFRFGVRVAPRPERVDSRFAVDPGFLGGAAMVLLLLGTVGVGTLLAPTARAVATTMDEEELIDVILQTPPPPTPTAGGKDEGAKAKDKEGARPKSDDKKPTKITAKSSDEKIAKRAGVLGGIDAVLGESAELSGALRDGVGALIGFNGQIGGNGLGARNGGLGGGGTAEGIGGLGPRGKGPGGPGIADGVGGTKLPGEIGAVSNEVLLLGQLDRAQIDEVVKRHLSAIRYCYQRELQREPELAGKVVAKFTIGGDGSVTASHTAGTLADERVKQCVAARFLTMKFPEPRGHGIVVVSYPFLFSRD